MVMILKERVEEGREVQKKKADSFVCGGKVSSPSSL